MSVDWEREGLLAGVDDPARRARAELLDELHGAGFSVDDLRRAVEGERLALLPLERALSGDGRPLSLRDMAERTGSDIDTLKRFRQAFGLPLPDDDEPVFGERDVPGFATLKVFLAAGLTEEQQLDLARVIGRNVAQIAEAIRGVIGRDFVLPGDTERDAALRFAALARTAAPAVGPILEQALFDHLRAQVRSDVFDVAGAPGEGGQEVAVAFADLVGFTRLGESVRPEDVGAIARRLGELAGDVAQPPIRLVKLIGDAAMLACREPAPLVDAVLRLVAAADAEGEGFPQLRAGVALGEAVNLDGDWYGRPVNLASRITERARPGSVLVTEAVRDAVADGAFAFSLAGRKRLRGVRDDPVLYRVRPLA